MQEESDNHELFSEKSEKLAAHLGVKLDELPARLGVSKDMFYAYRTGRYPISKKAWRKLREAEIAAGLHTSAASYGEPDQITRLEQGIAWLEKEVAALKTQRAAAEKALAERLAALDAELKAMPGVAEAVAAGLSLEDIRALIRDEIARRRARGELPPLPPNFDTIERDLQQASEKFKKPRPGQKRPPA